MSPQGGSTVRPKPFVALYTDSEEPSGLGAHLLALADQIAGKAELAIVCHDAPAARDLAERASRRGHEANVLPAGDAGWRTFSAWLKARRPDLLHVHAGIGWEGLAAPGLARRAGVGAVLRTEHLPYLLTDETQRADYSAMLADVDARICVSHASRLSYEAQGSEKRLFVVRNGVPQPTPSGRRRHDVRMELGLGPDQPAVLTVARFTGQKGYDVLLRAAHRVLESRPDTRFFWVGEGPLLEEVRATVQASGLRDSVRLLGARSDVPDLLQAADLFVLPSLFEGLPLALLEALRAGLPVVATAAPGTAEVFEEDEAAELVRPGSSDCMAYAILRVLNDPDLADELADRGQRLARRSFDARRMGEETLAVYRRLIGQAPARVAAVLQ